MYLFFDTETTGLPKNYNAPASSDDNFPRMVQLAFIITDDEGNILKKRNYIVKPEGFEIPTQASDIHGITTKIALKKGIDLEDVLVLLVSNAGLCDCFVAHNISFDEKIVDSEFLRCKIPYSFCEKKNKICTMKSTVDFCSIPSTNGFSGFKWAKLQELHEKLFGEKFDDAHNALADVEATVKCFFELKKLGII